VRAAVLVVAAALLGASGCGNCAQADRVAPESRPATAPSPPPAANTASLEGVVRLAEGYDLPVYRLEDMEKQITHIDRASLPAGCTPPQPSDRQPVRLTGNGLLSGVMLAASQFSHQPSRPPQTHEVVIRDCRLEPALVVAMKGDTLRIRNDVDYPFMPGPLQEAMGRTLSRGQVYDLPLSAPGVTPVVCGFTAPCGRTDVVVMLHPLYATTAASGNFRFENFPIGETVTLSAWHPLFQETRLEVHLEPGEHKQLELTLTPLTPMQKPPTEAASRPRSGAARHRPIVPP
jgi:hypothetical protein